MQSAPGIVYPGDIATVRTPIPEERRALGIGPGTPVIVVQRATGGIDLYPGEPGVICAAAET